jgi:hypothetical protein
LDELLDEAALAVGADDPEQLAIQRIQGDRVLAALRQLSPDSGRCCCCAWPPGSPPRGGRHPRQDHRGRQGAAASRASQPGPGARGDQPHQPFGTPGWILRARRPDEPGGRGVSMRRRPRPSRARPCTRSSWLSSSCGSPPSAGPTPGRLTSGSRSPTTTLAPTSTTVPSEVDDSPDQGGSNDSGRGSSGEAATTLS